LSYPSWVLDDVVAGLLNAVAVLETIAAEINLDASTTAAFSMPVATGPAPSATVAAATAPVAGLSNAMIALYNAIPMLASDVSGVDPSVAAGLFALAGGLASAMPAASAAAAFAAEADAIGDVAQPAAGTPNRLADAANLEIIARLSRAVMLSGYAQGLATQTYASRDDAITARADCVERFERELYLCAGAADAKFAAGLTRTRDACVDYLSQAIISLQPLVTVSANVPMPSLWWAWRLYQDPTMAADLIERNDVPHASFMPIQFTALAPATVAA
jgi:prophage DNA circulation protein